MNKTDRALVDEDFDNFLDFMDSNGWTDGLPVVPPTPKRVERMLATVPRDPSEVIATLAPRYGEATLERIAVNAVMAGCRPEYFPVVVTAVAIMGDPAFPLLAINTTTNPVALMCVVNGPIRGQLDINCSFGMLGPGWRANATIGRALRLVQLNIAGSIPGRTTMSTQGSPGRFTLCFGEFEERSPWQPYHVDQGFSAEDSTVTLGAVTGTTATSDTASKTADDLLITLAGAMEWSGVQTLRYGQGFGWLLLNPDHAEILGVRARMSKDEVRQALYERTSRFPLERLPPWERDFIRKEGRNSGDTAKVFPSPDHLRLVVAGGKGGLHATFCPPFVASNPITRKIELAAPA